MECNTIQIALLIFTLPLVAFVIQIFFNKKLPRQGDFISLGAIGGSFILSLSLLLNLFERFDPTWRGIAQWPWIGLVNFKVGLLVDNVTVLMLIVVTTVSFLVHLYSVGYMKGDPRYGRFFAYLSLFSFAMIGLVITDHLFVLYIFWELVGVSSYLLIGFWFEKNSAAAASKKAFLTTRVGDIGFFIGILIVYHLIGSLSYDSLFSTVGSGGISQGVLTWIGLCFFMGAVGKSAQFPLHIWLPDAMEGPTPISALIHAATMVAAGVYLVVRLFPVLTTDTLLVIAYTGGVTALFAASMAMVHTDIKKILAYSTVSQLGLMMLALGVGSYTAGFFHLVTHAAFKAGLFLVSGSVIHGLHGEQNIFNMGGLRTKMPLTFITCLITACAISGVPLFSGFVSKDLVLSGTLAFSLEHPGHFLLGVFGFGASALTAFYMFRLLFVTFFGQPVNAAVHEKAHESPWTMAVPLVMLSFLSFGFLYQGSFLGFNEVKLFGAKQNWFETLIQKPVLSPSLKTIPIEEGGEDIPILEQLDNSTKKYFQNEIATPLGPRYLPEAEGGDDNRNDGSSVIQSEAQQNLLHHQAHKITQIVSVFFALFGVFLAWLFYVRKALSAAFFAQKFGIIYLAAKSLYWIDEIYNLLMIRPLVKLCDFMFGAIDNVIIDQKIVDGSARWVSRASFHQGHFDNVVIDKVVDQTGKTTYELGLGLTKIQSGQVQKYLMVGLGVLIILSLWLVFS
ncbi:MAG: NADH-quinone oxidoreductase subunit L [Deltaproteobacteria bacterium]|nr:NADH-quinone oxidoreductase subunit L [Deltaproteobacteria bacterium]